MVPVLFLFLFWNFNRLTASSFTFASLFLWETNKLSNDSDYESVVLQQVYLIAILSVVIQNISKIGVCVYIYIYIYILCILIQETPQGKK
jgi:uncharacterized membrane protein